MGLEPREALEAWESIAPSFAAARQRPWPLVAEALAALPAGARVLDVGAGSGRHALAARDAGLEPVVLDAARGFLRRLPDGLRGAALQADAAALPVADASVDAVLLVAVLGALPRWGQRVAALREARRVLRPGGLLVLTAWARWQRKYLAALARRGPWRRTGPGEVLAPWPLGDRVVARPYHLPTRRGLRAELAAAGWRPPPPVARAALAPEGPPDNLVVVTRRP